MSDLVRVNIRVSPGVHEYFTERSRQTGVSMSALMFLALEQHVQQQMVIPAIPEMSELLRMIKDGQVSLSDRGD